LLKRFSLSEVKGQGQSEAKMHFPGGIAINLRSSVRCASGEGMPIDGAASRLPFLQSFVQSHQRLRIGCMVVT